MRETADDLYKVFESLHFLYLAVHWGVRAARQALIAMAKEHIMPNDTFTIVQRAQADSSDHSVAIENSHYGIKFNDVRRLSNYDLYESRWLTTEWQKTLGMFGPALRPLRERGVFKKEELHVEMKRVVVESLNTILPEAINNAVKLAMKQVQHDNSSKYSFALRLHIYLTLNLH